MKLDFNTELYLKILFCSMFAAIIGMGVFITITLNELNYTESALMDTIELYDELTLVSNSQERQINELNDVVDGLEHEGARLANENEELYMTVNNKSERIQRLETENNELKKSIADLHARRARRISADNTTISNADMVLMAQLIYSEARGEGSKGQQAVIDVVLNRLGDDRFPDTVRGVIMQPGQFDEASILHTYPATDEALRVVNSALNGNDVTNGAVFFWNPSVASNRWLETRTPVAQINNHQFLR